MSVFLVPQQFYNDEKGRTYPKMRLYFYETNTFNFKNVYSDAAKTQLLENPVIADGAGRLPLIYMDVDTEYRVWAKDRLDMPISPYIDNYSPASEDAGQFSIAETVADLRTIEPAFENQVITLIGHTVAGIGGGTFFFDNSDLSAEVAVDSLGGVYVGIPSDPTGASGAWVRDLHGFTSPDMYGVNDAISLQTYFDTCPLNKDVQINSDVNLNDGVVISRKLNITGGPGVLYFNAGIEGKGAFHITADGVTVDMLKMSNPNALGNTVNGTPRPYGIEIEANNVTITNCYLHQFQNPIALRSTGEWYNASIKNNYLDECLGAGGGQASASGDGEDRGDGITIWGAGSVALNNVVKLKAGEDGRVAVHAESLPGSAPVPGDYPDSSVMFSGNLIIGDWRRGLVFEGIKGGQANSNVVVGGTWHSLAIVKGCDECSMNNNVVYWNSQNTSWGSWGPRITPLMMYADCTNSTISGSTVYMKTGSKCMAGMTMENNNDGSNIDCSFIDNSILSEDDTVEFTEALLAVREFGGNQALRPVITGNVLKGIADKGIDIEGATDAIIEHNKVINISASIVASSRGVEYLGDGAGSIFSKNSIIGWDEGCFAGSNVRGIIHSNHFEDCNEGLSVGASITDCSIQYNEFTNITGSKITGLGFSNANLARNNRGQNFYHYETIDMPSIAAGATYTHTFTVAGVKTTTFIQSVSSSGLRGLRPYSEGATDQIKYELYNPTVSAIDRPSQSYRFLCENVGNF